MGRVTYIGTETRAVRRAELLLARVRQDCGFGLGALQVIEPLLTRIDRAVINGDPPVLADLDTLASAGQQLEGDSVLGGRVTEVLRHDLAVELRELAERLRPAAMPSPSRKSRDHDPESSWRRRALST